MKDQVLKFLKATTAAYLQEKKAEVPEGALSYDLVVSKDPSKGDFASNIAFKVAALVKESPKTVASDYISRMSRALIPALERVELGGGGFLNFYLAKTSLADMVHRVCGQDEKYGLSNHGTGKKVIVEFVSANPTGPLTIAHGRQAVVGDSLVRILKAAGYEVSAEFYLNDAGKQVQMLGQTVYARYCQALGQEVPIPEEGYQGLYLVETAEKFTQEAGRKFLKDPQAGAEAASRFAKEDMMRLIREDLEAAGVHFDSYFSEKSLYESRAVEKTLEQLKKKGYLFEGSGALWFRSTAFGDDKDRVVRKSTGELTYLAPDMAYHQSKFERGYQRLINLLGPDHHGYVGRLKAACAALGYPPEALEVRIVQLTTLYRKGEPVRMSKRAGEFETLHDLMKEVGVDATRFFFIMRKVESHLDFDLDLAKQKSQENPVYYLQYAHARISGILRNAPLPLNPKADVGLLISKEETDLIKSIFEFPQQVIDASHQLEPYRIADYLRELAAYFHKFYTFHRVLTEDPALSGARLLLVNATRIVLRNGLRLLGISQPETM